MEVDLLAYVPMREVVLYIGALGSLDRLGELCIYFCTSYLGSFQGSSRTCQRSIQTSDSSNTLLDGGSLASHNSHHD